MNAEVTRRMNRRFYADHTTDVPTVPTTDVDEDVLVGAAFDSDLEKEDKVEDEPFRKYTPRRSKRLESSRRSARISGR